MGLKKIPAVLITDKNLNILSQWEEKPKKAYKVQSDLLKKNTLLHETKNDSNITLKELMINSLENEYNKLLWNETISEINKIANNIN